MKGLRKTTKKLRIAEILTRDFPNTYRIVKLVSNFITSHSENMNLFYLYSCLLKWRFTNLKFTETLSENTHERCLLLDVIRGISWTIYIGHSCRLYSFYCIGTHEHFEWQRMADKHACLTLPAAFAQTTHAICQQCNTCSSRYVPSGVTWRLYLTTLQRCLTHWIKIGYQ
jgi:hypothetical protein